MNLRNAMVGMAGALVLAGSLKAREQNYPGCLPEPVLSQCVGGGQRESFDAGWRFLLLSGTAPAQSEVNGEDPACSDAQWRVVNLPHDWGIEGPFDLNLPGKTGKLPWPGVGWYRKRLSLRAEDLKKRIFLDFDGAMSDSTVYLNGEKVGGWPYGYSSFRVELTSKAKVGENLIAVRLDNKPEASRWYPGGGIYRHTWLVKTAPVHVAHWGVWVTTPKISSDQARVQVVVDVDNQSLSPADATLSVDIWRLGKQAERVASASPSQVQVVANATSSATLTATVAKPVIWDLKTPELYCALTTLRVGDQVVDAVPTVFGIRSVEIDPEKGLLLNGRKVPIKGVCLHHDLGALGAAFNLRAAERQLQIMKEMGCNSIRTSHNPPAPEVLDLCDRMGILVLAEAFDTWGSHKTPNDYARFFPEWHEKDLTAFARRDRNHPAIYLWSVGNEVAEQGKGIETVSHLVSLMHRLDPTRLVTVGCNQAKATKGFFRGMDVFGLNYKPHLYASFHASEPKVPLLGSETSSTISSRGEYFFPVEDKKESGINDKVHQVSSYDLSGVKWGTTPDTEFAAQDKCPFVIGEYVWTGFDYLGEPTPWNKDSTNLLNFQNEIQRQQAKAELEKMGQSPSRSSYFGIVDLAGFKKDRFYLYQAKWRPDLPMAHLLPHWTWPERVGQVTPVQVYTTGDEAELFLNGKSLGRKKRVDYRLRWDDVVYEPGALKVVAYKGGKPWAEEVIETAGEAKKLSIRPDRAGIDADGRDLSFITVSVTDAEGRLVPRAKNLVKFSVEGPGELVAVDNGDATSLEPFIAKQVKAYNGLCLAIVRGVPGKGGSVQIRAASEGLEEASALITTQ